MNYEAEDDETKDFEDLLEKVNGYGRFQKRLMLLFLLPISMAVSYLETSKVLMLSSPPHGCHEPTVATAANLSDEDKVLLTRPMLKDGLPDSCRMYDLSYGKVLEELSVTSKNVSSYVSSFSANWTTTKCKYGWDYDKSLYERTATTDWDLVCEKDYLPSLGFTLTSASSSIATPILGAISDKYGRRSIFFIITVVLTVSSVLVPILPHFAGFLTAKVIQASTTPSNFQLPYLILLETVSPDKRNAINVISFICWCAGMGMLSLVAWLTGNWIWLAWTCTFLCPIFIYNCWILPESPRWLISQDRFEEAKAVFGKIAKENRRDISHLDMIILLKKCSHNEQSMTSKQILKDLIRKPILLKRMVFVIVVWSSLHIAYNAFNLNVSVLHGNEFLNFFLLALVEVPSYLLSWYMMETKLGRRWSSVIFLFFSSLVCILPITASENTSTYLTVASLIGKFGVSASFMIIYQQCVEICPTPIRSSGLAMSGTIAQTLSICSPSIIYLSTYGRHIPYTVISILCFISGFVATLIPETLNENLPQTLEDGETFGRNRPFFSFAKTKSSLKSKTMSEIVLQEATEIT